MTICSCALLVAEGSSVTKEKGGRPSWAPSSVRTDRVDARTSRRSGRFYWHSIWQTSSASDTQSALQEDVQQLGSCAGEQTAATHALQLVHCRGPTVHGSWQLQGCVVVVVAPVVVVVTGARVVVVVGTVVVVVGGCVVVVAMVVVVGRVVVVATGVVVVVGRVVVVVNVVVVVGRVVLVVVGRVVVVVVVGRVVVVG